MMMSRGGESIEVEEKREITATTATTRMDEELDEERRDVNDENENNTPLSVNDFDFERWLEHDESKQKRKRTKKEIERAILSMESRTRKNARELSDTQESLEKFKGKKPDVVLKFLSELILSSSSSNKNSENKGHPQANARELKVLLEEEGMRDWFDRKSVNVSDEQGMIKLVNENVLTFQNVRRKVERETYADEKRAWMEKKRIQREKERKSLAKSKQKQIEQLQQQKQREKKGYASTKNGTKNAKIKKPKIDQKRGQEHENDKKKHSVPESNEWIVEDIPEELKALREYIVRVGGKGYMVKKEEWVIKKKTRKHLKNGERKSYKLYFRSDGTKCRSRIEVAMALGLGS